MDEPAFPGCLVPLRLIGVIEAEQTEDGKTEPQRPADRRRGEVAQPPRDPDPDQISREPGPRDRALLRLVQRGPTWLKRAALRTEALAEALVGRGAPNPGGTDRVDRTAG